MIYQTRSRHTLHRSMPLWIFMTAVILTGFSCKRAAESEADRWERRAEQVTIYRDDYGIPHIYAKTDADAVFGLLYAQCEDDFNRVERNYIWAIGRLAEVEGESALYSDLRARLFMTREEAIAAYQDSPPWLKELCDAFADGVNYYLHTHPGVKPKLLTRFEPWMPMYFSEGSIGGDIERVSTRKLRELYEEGHELPLPLATGQALEAAASGSAEDVAGAQENSLLATAGPAASELPAVMQEEPQGSNGIAISGALTQSGNPMLLINPHTSFYFRGEVHVVSEEGLNAYGAVTWGQFFVYQGFNERTGWMHTSTYTDVIDEYREDITKVGDSLVYAYGETLRPVWQSDVTLSWRDGEQLKTRAFPVYRTHHGPITHRIGEQAVATAMMWDPVTALQQSFIRTKQDSYEGFRDMMELKTNSSNNTVYADADGNIAYFHGNFIPRRDTRFNFRKPVDGSNPATDWQGLHPVSESIHLLNPPNGWLQNCNSTPYTAALEYSPKRGEYPDYMTLDRENFRGVHAIGLLKERSGYTLDSLTDLAYDPYLPAFEALIPGLVAAYDQRGPGAVSPAMAEAMEAAIGLLRTWDFRTSEASVAMTLAHYYGTRYNQEGKAPGHLTSMERIRFFGQESPQEERLGLFREVLQQLTDDFGTWQMPWGEVNRYQRLDGSIRQAFDDEKPSIPIGFASGRWGALAAYGARYHNNTKKIYGTRGNSFVAVVEFGNRVRARSILAGGQSGDPQSPHFDDQARPYAAIRFKDVPYYREDVEARAEEMYQPGKRKEGA